MSEEPKSDDPSVVDLAEGGQESILEQASAIVEDSPLITDVGHLEVPALEEGRPPRKMALGDDVGTTVDNPLDKLTESVNDADAVSSELRVADEVHQILNALYPIDGGRKLAKSIIGKLQCIQSFNTMITGRPRTLDVFFPNTVGLVMHYLLRHRFQPGVEQQRFTPIPADHRPVFIGLVRHFAGINK